MNHYLLRFIETGRDAQRKKQPRDLASQLPNALLESIPGRLFVSSEEDLTEVIARLHGVSSFSPCLPCSVEEIPTKILELDLSRAKSFAVKVKRFGNHDFSSLELAKKLAGILLARWPLAVDLRKPDVTVGVEIREQRAWIFDRVIEGVDRRGSALADIGDKLVADQMLGRLAAWLRMLGFDTTYVWDLADSEVVRRANAEGRVLLTRDRPLSKNQAVRVYYVKSRIVEEQVREVITSLHLKVNRSLLFSRCALCNSPLTPVDKQSVKERIPPTAFAHYSLFALCPACDKIYWAGSHYQRVLAALGDLITD